MYPFFKSILGPGQPVLEALSKASSELASYLPSRIVVSWLRQSDYGSVKVPQECPLKKLIKNGYGYSGLSSIGGVDYTFENVAEEHVAAIITIAEGQQIHPVEVKDIDLAKLAKTIDLLVKANKLQYERTQNARYLEPEEPVEPDTVQAKPVKTLSKIPKIPQLPQLPKIPKKPSNRKLTVQKSETQKDCSICGKKMFANNQFVGCLCFKPLVKNIKSVDNKLSVTLSFDEDVDEDAMLALIGALKHGR